MLKRIIKLVGFSVVALALASCSPISKVSTEPEKLQFDNNLTQFSEIPQGEEVAIMETNMGTIKIRFFKDIAPKTVENFVTHAKSGYYDGVKFHRVIEDFMIQSGDPLGTGRGGESIWGEPFEDEFDPRLHNYRGAISMANPGVADSNGSQFFIVQKKNLDPQSKQQIVDYTVQNPDNIFGVDASGNDVYIKDFYPTKEMEKYYEVGGTPHLDFKHTVFGIVYEGMEIVDAIAHVDVDENDGPITPVTIKSIKIEEYVAE